MNITDIDDKTIRDSVAEGTPLAEFTKRYTDIFMQDLEHLNITSFNRFKPISELVEEMIEMIQILIDKEYAYRADDGSIYYSVSKFSSYGQLANIDTSGMKAGVRVDNDEYEKDDVADFVLWKAYDPERDGDNFWEGTFTFQDSSVTLKWRPGWHIECSACNKWGFWDQIDIHMGGIDNLFPHHQNEVAQTEACSGKEFCKTWIHLGHLLVDGKKMSKSAGNFYTLKDLVSHEDHDLYEETVYRSFRLMRLQNLYRDNFNFTFERLKSASNSLRNFDNTLSRLMAYEWNDSWRMRKHIRDDLQTYMQEFVTKLEDDFDTVNALAVVFSYLTFVNKELDSGELSETEAQSLLELYVSFDNVFGLHDWSSIEEESTIPQDLQDMLDARTVAKLDSDYMLADQLRAEIESRGYGIIDDSNGSRLEKKG